ncbi:hypothetical protein TraAM80_01950, partial [Trypanosoma rangeli]
LVLPPSSLSLSLSPPPPCSARRDSVALATQKDGVREVLGPSLLPPSPILGYTLRKEGLIDESVRPPQTLSSQDLRLLTAKLSSVEQQVRYSAETRFTQQVHNRERRGLELIVSLCLYMCGLYLTLWKAPRLYFGMTPRSSVFFFTRLLLLMRWDLPEVEKERMTRNHSWLFQPTNARVALSFLTGCTLTAIAVATRPTLDVLDVGPDVELGKQSVGFQKHSEAVLRWL